MSYSNYLSLLNREDASKAPDANAEQSGAPSVVGASYFISSIGRSAAIDVQQLDILHPQPKEVMDYLVLIATATCLAIGAFVVHRMLPKQ